MLQRLETASRSDTSLLPLSPARPLGAREVVDERLWRDARDRPDVACAQRRQVRPRAFGRPVVPTSPQPPPGAAARAFVS